MIRVLVSSRRRARGAVASESPVARTGPSSGLGRFPPSLALAQPSVVSAPTAASTSGLIVESSIGAYARSVIKAL
jgi:hypothetical protein